MLLERLREYSDRLDLAPPMYQKSPIKWLIDLDETGKLLTFVSTTEGKEGKKDRGKVFDVPHIGRSSGIKAKLLADTGEYVLGLA
jgi:CRISPR-associated protein Csd1